MLIGNSAHARTGYQPIPIWVRGQATFSGIVELIRRASQDRETFGRTFPLLMRGPFYTSFLLSADIHQGGGGDLPLTESDPGKSEVEELLAAFAGGLGIDRTRLRFKWEQKPFVLPEHGREPVQQVLDLRISFGKKSEVLTFSEELVRRSATESSAFVMKYTDYVMAKLKRLSQPEKGSAEK